MLIITSASDRKNDVRAQPFRIIQALTIKTNEPVDEGGPGTAAIAGIYVKREDDASSQRMLNQTGSNDEGSGELERNHCSSILSEGSEETLVGIRRLEGQEAYT